MPDEHSASNASTEAKTPRQSKFLTWVTRILTAALCLVVLAVMFVPWIAGRMISGAATEQWISGQIPGHVRIGDASVGWHSPIMLNDISLSDDDGKELAQVKAVTSNQTFWDLFRKKTQPIELEFEGLSAKVAIPNWKPTAHPGKADIKKAFQSLLKQSMPNFGREVTVRVINSRFDLTDQSGTILNSWSPISGEYHSTSGTNKTHTIQLQAPVSQVSENAPDTPSTAATTVSATWSTNPIGGDLLDLEIGCQRQPLLVLQELVTPISPEAEIPPVTGKITGQLQRLGQQSATLQVSTQLADNISDSSPVDLDIQATYSGPTDDIQIHQLYAQVDETEVQVAGEVTQLSGPQNLNMQGRIQSPAETFVNLLPPELKENVSFTDLQLGEISIKGPLRPNPNQPWNLKFEISTVAAWKEATAYGLKSMDGQVRITLTGTDVKLEPVSLPVSQGHIRALPSFDLSTKSPTVVIEKKLMLDNVALTEEVCRDWMQFVSPLLSQATATEGTFSLIPEAARFELNSIEKSEMSGTLQIHQGRVRPGPMADDLLASISQIAVLNGTRLANADNAVLLSVDDQSIPYQVHDGRVYHADFNFMVGNLKLTSQGSVGFDKSLDVLVSMPFPEKWTNRGPILNALQGESLDFHLVGTLDQPKLNARPLRESGERIGIKAAEGLLNRLLERRKQRRP